MNITIETVLKANLGSVWDAWKVPEDIKQWNTAQNYCIDLLTRGAIR
jgi:uncharacterized protein YndB with AHSA1/START domain